jgi:hypothetical protein
MLEFCSLKKTFVLYCQIQGILADILKCLGDNKKLTRETVIKTLDIWSNILQLDKVVRTINL